MNKENPKDCSSLGFSFVAYNGQLVSLNLMELSHMQKSISRYHLRLQALRKCLQSSFFTSFTAQPDDQPNHCRKDPSKIEIKERKEGLGQCHGFI